MYRFYSAGYLHQIRTLNIKPDRTSSAKPDTNLVLTLSIEALSLPAAEARNSLPKEPSHALQLAKLVDYQPIVTRNFFGPYVRPPLPPDPPTGSRDKPPIRELAVVDAAQFAVVTAITQVDDEPQVWIQDRMGGVLWKLAAGESFAVGTARWKEQGTVQSINSEEVVVDFRNARRLLHNGDSIVSGPMQAVPAMTPTAISVPDRGPASGNASPPLVVAGDPTQPANAFGRGGRGGRGGGRGGSSRNNRQAPVGTFRRLPSRRQGPRLPRRQRRRPISPRPDEALAVAAALMAAAVVGAAAMPPRSAAARRRWRMFPRPPTRARPARPRPGSPGPGPGAETACCERRARPNGAAAGGAPV